MDIDREGNSRDDERISEIEQKFKDHVRNIALENNTDLFVLDSKHLFTVTGRRPTFVTPTRRTYYSMERSFIDDNDEDTRSLLSFEPRAEVIFNTSEDEPYVPLHLEVSLGESKNNVGVDFYRYMELDGEEIETERLYIPFTEMRRDEEDSGNGLSFIYDLEGKIIGFEHTNEELEMMDEGKTIVSLKELGVGKTVDLYDNETAHVELAAEHILIDYTNLEGSIRKFVIPIHRPQEDGVTMPKTLAQDLFPHPLVKDPWTSETAYDLRWRNFDLERWTGFKELKNEPMRTEKPRETDEEY